MIINKTKLYRPPQNPNKVLIEILPIVIKDRWNI